MRSWALAILLALAALLIVVGVGKVHEAAAWIVGGLLLAAWSFLLLAEVSP